MIGRAFFISLVISFLSLTSSPVYAAPCTTLPKSGLKADEILISVHRAAGAPVTSIYLAWPTNDPNIACCLRSHYNHQGWQAIFDANKTTGDTSPKLTDYMMGITPYGPALTDADQAQCKTMMDRVLPPITVVRNTLRADGSRPLKVLRDPAQPYSTTNPLVNLLANGVQVYVEAGRPCERVPVINTTTSGKWLYTTNLAGQRGIALCK